MTLICIIYVEKENNSGTMNMDIILKKKNYTVLTLNHDPIRKCFVK